MESRPLRRADKNAVLEVKQSEAQGVRTNTGMLLDAEHLREEGEKRGMFVSKNFGEHLLWGAPKKLRFLTVLAVQKNPMQNGHIRRMVRTIVNICVVDSILSGCVKE